MEQTPTLDCLKLGQTAIIKKVTCIDVALKRRILDMGLTPGTVVKLVNIAPLNDPYAFKVYDYVVAIRKETLKFIECEVIEKSLDIER